VAIQIQVKRGIAANRPSLVAGEFYYATDTQQVWCGSTPVKVGSSIVATVDLTAQTAAKSTTALLTPSVNGLFRISIALKLTTVGTSPVIGPVTITYTDADGSVAQSIVMLLHSVTGTVVTTTVNNSTTTSNVNGSVVIFAKSGVAISYAIAQSGTIGSGQWSAHIRCEAM
jgi:hypothetical protein